MSHSRVEFKHPCVGKSPGICRVEADRLRDGRWLCHLHDPEGIHQQRRRERQQDGRKARPVAKGTPWPEKKSWTLPLGAQARKPRSAKKQKRLDPDEFRERQRGEQIMAESRQWDMRAKMLQPEYWNR